MQVQGTQQAVKFEGADAWRHANVQGAHEAGGFRSGTSPIVDRKKNGRQPRRQVPQQPAQGGDGEIVHPQAEVEHGVG